MSRLLDKAFALIEDATKHHQLIDAYVRDLTELLVSEIERRLSAPSAKRFTVTIYADGFSVLLRSEDFLLARRIDSFRTLLQTRQDDFEVVETPQQIEAMLS